MKYLLSPSILAADFWRLGEQIKAAEEEGISYLHIDVMDGMFVPDISFGMPVIESIRKSTDLFFDVHLMIEQPERYVEEFARCGADLINFHLEATEDVSGTIAKIRSLGKKAGITIKPATPVSALEPYLGDVDMILVMTVEPGFGGQKLMPECLQKVRELRELCVEKGVAPDIEVDGGITKENLSLALEAGANVIVAGSAVFRGDTAANTRGLQEVLQWFARGEEPDLPDPRR
ncbi:MAG: ribulose-phosphate 3-epimerase [Lachnospiraceae bacterium]|nr:ribulose-phosphate 3-epimerase [Lachnospiraceae bacterium]